MSVVTADAPALAGRSNPYATWSIGLAIAVTVLAILSRITTFLAPAISARWGLPAGVLGGVLGALGGLGLILAVAAAVVGGIGVRQRDRPHLLAAAGLAIGATAAVTYLLNLVSVTLVASTVLP